jgi:Ca-activated chloride channel family protein
MKRPTSPTKVVCSALLLSAACALLLVIIGCASTYPMGPPAAGTAGQYAGDVASKALRRPGVPAPVEPIPSEELWVIAKPQAPAASPAQEPGAQAPATQPATPPIPGSGALLARLPDRSEPVVVPLKHTDVKAHVAGYIATVDVTQQYHNPYAGKIEAVYVFPLPSNAAVNEFLMTIGQRKIRGIIRERAEAERIYADARRQGYVASLLTQERPNVFTQAVANIEPGKQIDVNVKYFHTLEYTDGWYEFVFPMVVGPRFNPPGSRDGIGAKAHGAVDRTSGQKTEVSYLRDHQRSGHDISLAVNIEAGTDIERIECRSHRVDVANPQQGVAQVTLRSDDSIPNKDFVLRYKIAGDHVKTALMTHRDDRAGSSAGGGYFTLMIIPPDSMTDLPRQPLELVFTLDVSGSMNGRPIEQSRAAIRYTLTHMRPDDTFQIVRFAGATEQMSDAPLPATPENVRRGLEYVEQMQAAGGTMMLEGIKRALNFPGDPSRLRFVAMLTDGYIGNESDILREVKSSRGNARVFSFGVGQAPNRYLLDGMAKLGAGVAAYLSFNDPAEQIMADFFDRISHPALVDVSVDWGGMRVSEVYPQRVPDLFVGRPVILTGKYTGDAATTIKVRGKVGGEQRVIEIPVKPDDAQARHKGIASVWARMKIADLSDQSTWQADGNFPQLIKQTALEHGLMSAYTAFVAVDSSRRTDGDHGTTVSVPVPVPEGVRYETTVPQ